MKTTPVLGSRLSAWILLFPLLVLFCFPGGAVLAELTQRRSTLEWSLTVEMTVAVLCTIAVACAVVSRWSSIRCAGCAVALIGYGAVANLLMPGQEADGQLASMAAGGVLGVVAGKWLAPRKPARPRERQDGEPAAEAGPPPNRPTVSPRRLVVLGGAVACVLLVLLLRDRDRAAMQARIADAVERSAGLVVFDDHLTPTVVFNRLARLPRGATGREWDSLSGVDLGPSAKDEELTELAELGLTHLPDLGQLSLRRSQVSDAGLVVVEPMVRLRRLSLGPATTDVGLAHVQGLIGLQSLDLSKTRITGNGLRFPRDLPDLNVLNLSHTAVTDDDLACLKEFPSLVTLYLAGTPITDAGLVHLKDMPEIRYLTLTDTRVSDAGIVHLKNVPGLRWVFLGGTAVTAAGRRDLARSRPGLNVIPLTDPEPSAAKARRAEPRR